MSKEGKFDKEGEKTDDSPYDKAYHVCAMAGSRLMHNDAIRLRIRTRLLELFSDEKNIDAEHTRIIFQDRDLTVKLSAIREANRLKKRVNDDPPVPPGAAPITRIEIVMPKK